MVSGAEKVKTTGCGFVSLLVFLQDSKDINMQIRYIQTIDLFE
jgi:hypothetical protein